MHTTTHDRSPARRGIHKPGRRWFAAAFLVATVAGCGGGTNMKLGRQAEKQGAFHVAHRYYCDEARRHPGRGSVRAAIARVAPRAAQHYALEAARAVDEGRYATGWRLYMRALTITPDDPALARLVRVLEEQHAEEVAPAKAAFMRHGAASLTITPVRELPEYHQPGASPPPPPADQPPDATRIEEFAEPPDAGPPAEPQVMISIKPPTDRRSPSASTVPRRGAAPTDDTEPKTADEGRPEEAPVAIRPVRPRPDERGQRPPHAVGYLASVIVSVEDKRFPRRAHLFDDIHVRLNDTDSDPEAEFDVYLGRKRVAEGDDFRLGDVIRVRGRSGEWYEIFLITIVHETETVRLGIRPARGAAEEP
jgi:hypothetical protein